MLITYLQIEEKNRGLYTETSKRKYCQLYMKIRIVSSSPSTRSSKEASCCNHLTISSATNNQRTKYCFHCASQPLCCISGWFMVLWYSKESLQLQPQARELHPHNLFKTSRSSDAWATCTIFCFLWSLLWDPRSACNQKVKFRCRSVYKLYLPYVFLNSLNDKSNRSTTETASETFVSSKVIGKPEYHCWQICCLIYVCEIPFINISRHSLYLMQSCNFLA